MSAGARIGNVVFDAPCAGSLDTYGRAAGAIATLYAELLGMHKQSRAEMLREAGYDADAGDEVDPLVRSAGGEGIGIAFESQSPGYEPPRWPDPEYPQQMHVDVFVADVVGADQLVLGLGAKRLSESDGHRVYADPVGHPFCLYSDQDASTARIGRIVFDCFSPRSLARFYSDLMEMPRCVEDSATRVVIARDDGRLPMLAFQHSISPAPRWPDPAYPEQVHLDLGFDTVAARADAERLGAILLREAEYHSVYADPAGHPFCI